MASPAADSYAAASGVTVHAGRWPGGAVSGTAVLGDVGASGSLAQNLSTLQGSATLSDVASTGGASGLILPTWLQGKALYEWVAVPNSTWIGSPGESSNFTGGFGGQKTGFVNAENGSALDRRTGELWQFGGGHSDYAGNEIASIVLSAESPQWQLRRDHSAQADITLPGQPDRQWNLDGRPNTRHTYQGTLFIEKLNRYMAIGGFLWSNAGGAGLEPAVFDASAGDWEPQGTWNNTFPITPGTPSGFFVKHPVTEDVYFGEGGGYRFYKLDTNTKAWSVIKAPITGYFPAFECATIDSVRNGMFVVTTRGDANGAFTYAAMFNLVNGARTDITINPSEAWTSFKAMSTDHAGVHYNPDQDVYYCYFGGGLTTPAITYTAGGSTGGSTGSNPNSSAFKTTAITMSGPADGAVNVASAPFTVGFNGTLEGSVTVTPAARGIGSPSGGVFSPTSVTLSAANPTATFTYTPLTAGQKSISLTAEVSGRAMGGRIFKITPNNSTTWDMEEMTMTGAVVPDGVGVANGQILTRFGYVPNMRAVFAFPSATSPIYMARVA